MPRIDEAWQVAVREAIDSHPTTELSGEEFARYAETNRKRGARSEHLGELYLAWACGLGDPTAIRLFDRLISSDVQSAAARINSSPSFVDEVAQSVRVRLLVGDGKRKKIGDYIGRGPLRAWAGVVALRCALNLRRSVKGGTSDLLVDLVDQKPDPELDHLRTLYRAEFRAAVHEALSSLPDRQRALLRLCYVDGLRINQLARLYQVHETTASRWLKRATEEVAKDARRRLKSRLCLSPSTLDSVTRLVISNLDLSISRILVSRADG